MSGGDVISYFEDRVLAHEILNHVHVICGNLQMLAEEKPEDKFLQDAHHAAKELSRIFGRFRTLKASELR
jgi:sensor histidine kinase regulating citrate/malate metabolism